MRESLAVRVLIPLANICCAVIHSSVVLLYNHCKRRRCMLRCLAASAHMWADRVSMAQLFFAVSGAGNSTTLVLILTELTGFYALSTVLLIRKQLPPKYRHGLSPCTLTSPWGHSEHRYFCQECHMRAEAERWPEALHHRCAGW